MAWNIPRVHRNNHKAKSSTPTLSGDRDESFNDPRHQKIISNPNNDSPNRRAILLLAPILTITAPQVAHAGEVGARITRAVTQSDLGISVRKSVVRGAQVIDQVDGQWERFSDQFGLGAERNKQVGRPTPKVIPDPLPLDATTAKAILDITDGIFLSLLASTGIKRETLEAQINKVATLVRPSFERNNGDQQDLMLSASQNNIQTAAQFNFYSYVHFKAYSDLIIQQGKEFDFNAFRRSFEKQTGDQLVALLLPQDSERGKQQPKTELLLNAKFNQIEQLCQQLKQKGLLSLTERSEVDRESILDWIDDTNSLSFTLALDGDITLGSQMLLQEQGFRLYPDYPRFAVLSLLQNIEGQEAQIDDYYFDTDYNSDPDKFEVKEVVLSVVLDSV
ncbi:expressed unknown protein [Seminavis robusta]|uniref:Uncharacterized protein n=1 Tax=Seminavis robusta TaxID=568900 RepID=A0A9N8ELM2_9STRA|nr:expressed unknown protein [Seminavis robusta]|eukprot:Sro1203_g252130.1 n/a (391) ;mRNA; r:28148-29320